MNSVMYWCVIDSPDNRAQQASIIAGKKIKQTKKI
jgi:hypothetical protein